MLLQRGPLFCRGPLPSLTTVVGEWVAEELLPPGFVRRESLILPNRGNAGSVLTPARRACRRVLRRSSSPRFGYGWTAGSATCSDRPSRIAISSPQACW